MKRTPAMLILLCCAIVTTVQAQTGWLPRTVNMGPKLTGANRAAAIARLEAIERLVKQVPELAHPDGFEIRADYIGLRSRTGLNHSEHADYAVEYRYTLVFFAPKFTPSTFPHGAIVFMINSDGNYGAWVDPQGRDIIIEESRWPRTPFSVVTYGVSASGALKPGEDFSLSAWFAPGAELPWRAVSREDYYTSFIANVEGNKGEKRAEYSKNTEKTPYQRWIDEAPQRKKEREETLKTLAQIQPAAEVAKLRKTLEDAERDAGEQFKKSESQDREDARTAFAPTDAVRAELNRMTPAQRKLPAILDTDPTLTEWKATGASMRDRDTVNALVHRVLTPNYDVWRARKSLADVRTIQVYLEGAPEPQVLNAIYQMYKKFDWRALAALIDPPTRE